MDDFDEKDETKRKSRNLSEKKRRDQFNILVTELGTMVSPNNRKMDKTTVLKSTINFLMHQKESSNKSQVHEIQSNWKPSFLSNEEFIHLMLEALEGFILVFTTDGSIVYASESVTSLLGFLPHDIMHQSIFEMVHERDKIMLYNSLNSLNEMSFEKDSHFYLHFKRMDIQQKEDAPTYELVKLTGYFRKWSLADTHADGNNSDDDDISLQSGYSRLSTQDGTTEKSVFVCTARVQTAQLLREMPLTHFAQSEFISRYSLEWKFLFLDHRAPPIIGYLPIELLGNSGYDYYHMDDLERISLCHEALMQTGGGTSCIHRFLSKGQHWVWLQTRYFISYHQWNSKPEFVVATHRVVSYLDVIKEFSHDADEKESDIDPHARYPNTDSPTWSSKSSMCGSSGTGVSSSKISLDHKHSYSDTNLSDGVPHPMSSFECMSRSPGPQVSRSNKAVVPAVRVPELKAPETRPTSVMQMATSSSQSSNGFSSPATVLVPAPMAAVPNPHLAMSSRPHIVMTPAQLQLQEQLRTKHNELSQRIVEQQEELHRISEQLVMSQYGLVPVTVTFQETPTSSTVVRPDLATTPQSDGDLDIFPSISRSGDTEAHSTGAAMPTSGQLVSSRDLGLRSRVFYASVNSNDFDSDPLLPQLQVDPRQSIAVHPRVQEWIRDIKVGPLNGGDVITGVANHLGEGDLSDLGQLRVGEANEWIASLVPEPVTFAQISELDPNDAGESGTHQTTMEWSLGQST
eukprot:maker-scaffold292_size219010-snap-gene-1.33 protein:Tk00321 transcript:maker-scaffold292_size219010-snap-gene-1.33-mRNA-1 annotation:"PREDICTED: hypothetical protein LOC100650446"